MNFAQTLNNVGDIPLSLLSSSWINGDLISIQIDVDVYLVGLEEGKNHLHGRIVLSKGDKPLTHMNMSK